MSARNFAMIRFPKGDDLSHIRRLLGEITDSFEIVNLFYDPTPAHDEEDYIATPPAFRHFIANVSILMQCYLLDYQLFFRTNQHIQQAIHLIDQMDLRSAQLSGLSEKLKAPFRAMKHMINELDLLDKDPIHGFKLKEKRGYPVAQAFTHTGHTGLLTSGSLMQSMESGTTF